ncbi:hypothetical protein LVD15_05680 [Fulvivirga maritima]|uniref:hypothetical protein n=1 Tax=Fulvivirga maritima TaxID=2904247 RepID=UPI001F481481|nr:hypothetical protein [Fulvivirga maritima]UII27910.1 hypothetical protein LVD15_05680 [Fulvivirga maritima]
MIKVPIIILLTSILQLSMAQGVKKIKVVNTKNIAVKCKLYFNGKAIGYTVNGEVDIPVNCEFMDKVDIEPVDTQTYDGRKGIKCYLIKEYIIVYKFSEKSIALNNANFLQEIPSESLQSLDSEEKGEFMGK